MAGLFSDLLPELAYGLGAGLAGGVVVLLLAAVGTAEMPGRKPDAATDAGRDSSTGVAGLGARAAVALGGCAGVSLSLSVGGLLAAYFPPPEPANYLQTAGPAVQSSAGLAALAAAVLVSRILFSLRRRTGMGLTGMGQQALAPSGKPPLGTGVWFAASLLSVAQIGIPSAGWMWRSVGMVPGATAPLLGALAGLVLAAVTCWLIHRWLAAGLDMSSVTRGELLASKRARSVVKPPARPRRAGAVALLLLMIGAAIQLATGLGGLQHAGWLPGQNLRLFSLSDQSAGSPWWAGLLVDATGQMAVVTLLQLAGFLLALLAAAAVCGWGRRATAASTPRKAGSGRSTSLLPASAGRRTGPGMNAGAVGPSDAHGGAAPPVKSRLSARRPWLAVALGAPVVIVAPFVLSMQPAAIASESAATASGQATAVTVTEKSCAPELANVATGTRTFTVTNTSRWPLEVYLTEQPDGGILARTAIVGPGTSGRLNAVLAPGNYGIECLQSGQQVAQSATVTAVGSVPQNATAAIPATAAGDLLPATNLYSKYVQSTLGTLDGQVANLKASLVADGADASKQNWLAAQETWQSLGAAYGSFGELGAAVNAQPHGSGDPGQAPVKDPAKDPAFTGLHRIEYGLYHGESPATLVPVVQALQEDLAKLRKQLPSLVLIPANMPLRAHEILEDALRDHLSGQDDQGSGMAFALTAADVAGTRVVVDRLASVLEARKPGLVKQIGVQLDTLDAALQATKMDGRWTRYPDSTLGQRQPVNAAISAVLETLAQVPQLLQLPAGSE